jgi:hypothetical protein
MRWRRRRWWWWRRPPSLAKSPRNTKGLLLSLADRLSRYSPIALLLVDVSLAALVEFEAAQVGEPLGLAQVLAEDPPALRVTKGPLHVVCEEVKLLEAQAAGALADAAEPPGSRRARGLHPPFEKPARREANACASHCGGSGGGGDSGRRHRPHLLQPSAWASGSRDSQVRFGGWFAGPKPTTEGPGTSFAALKRLRSSSATGASLLGSLLSLPLCMSVCTRARHRVVRWKSCGRD